jgi:hypothetical protein
MIADSSRVPADRWASRPRLAKIDHYGAAAVSDRRPRDEFHGDVAGLVHRTDVSGKVRDLENTFAADPPERAAFTFCGSTNNPFLVIRSVRPTSRPQVAPPCGIGAASCRLRGRYPMGLSAHEYGRALKADRPPCERPARMFSSCRVVGEAQER